MKTCKTCKEHKKNSEFFLVKQSPDGLHANCKSCCKWVLASYRVKRRDKKSKISNRQYQRAKAAGVQYEWVELYKVYQRDKGICHICKKFVPSNLASPDHVEPISKGGSHTYDNVKLSHIKCNKRKGAK